MTPLPTLWMSRVSTKIKLPQFLSGHSPASLIGRNPGNDSFVAKTGLGHGPAWSSLGQLSCGAAPGIQPGSPSISRSFSCSSCWGYNSNSFLISLEGSMPGFYQHIPDLCQLLRNWICLSISLFLETLTALPRIPFFPSHISLNILEFCFSSVAPSYKGAETIPFVMELPFGLTGFPLSLQVILFIPGAGKQGSCDLILSLRSQITLRVWLSPKASSPGGGKFKIHPGQTFPKDSELLPWMSPLELGEVAGRQNPLE